MNKKPAKAFVGKPSAGHTGYHSNIPRGAFEPCQWVVTPHSSEREAEEFIKKHQKVTA